MVMDNKFLKRQLLCWLSYNPKYKGENNKVLYLYPCYLNNQKQWELIDNNYEFPKYGRIEVIIVDKDTHDNAESLLKQFGPIVFAYINSPLDFNYNDFAKNTYISHYDKSRGKQNSNIWLETANTNQFYEIIDCHQDINNILNNRQYDLSDDDLLLFKAIMFRTGNMLYGPFEYTKDQNKLQLSALERFDYIVGSYDCDKFGCSIVTVKGQTNENESICLFPISLLPAPKSCLTKYDFIDPKLLSNKFLDLVRDKMNLSSTDTQALRQIFDDVTAGNQPIEFSESRLELIQRHLSVAFLDNEIYLKMIKLAFDNEELRKKLISDLANTDSNNSIKELFSQYIAENKDTISNSKKVQEDLLNNKTETNTSKQPTSPKQPAAEPPSSFDFEEIIELLDLTCKQLKEQQDQNVQTLKELKYYNLTIPEQQNKINEQIRTLKELEDLNRKLEDRNTELKRQNEQQGKLAEELSLKLKESLKEYKNSATIAVKMLDSKLMEEIMGQSATDKGEVSSDETIATLAPNFDTKLLAEKNSVDSAFKISNHVCRFLNEVGHRNLDINDVTNYLICITQGFITTFAGEPGTGKTSLCNLLARALGLARAKGASRFSEVSVERGWTSLKDLIGYYNPLTKCMVKSNAEIFDAFVNLNREAQLASDGSAYDRAKIAPYFILLDEANLSPIEHYWAAFFRNCDFIPLSQRTISLGGDDNWLLPEHLRFLATVNFDHTTEELSPRFLDRSWVITLEPKKVKMNQDEYPDHDESMVPFESLLTAFSAHDGDKLDEPLADKWRAIQAIFAHEKCALPLSPRNIRMVHNYCLVAARCMSRATTSTKFAPLDYAVAQKILPTINGSGERYRYLITELQKECTEQTMPLCAHHLKRIKRIGEAELGFYQFFAH